MSKLPKRKRHLIKKIFKDQVVDLINIINDQELLRLHIHFVKTSSLTEQVCKNITIESCTGKIVQPRTFPYFKTKYENIYRRWIHLIRSCYDKNYNFYRFFGAKGIKMSVEFLDSRKFCIWCLKNGLVRKPFTYDQYLQRKDKTRAYKKSNCYIITEKSIHECTDLKTTLFMLYLTKSYKESHDVSVRYYTFLTRYFMYDMDVSDSRSLKYEGRSFNRTVGFVPHLFWKSVSNEDSVSFDVFVDRLQVCYDEPNLIFNPYDVIKKDFSLIKEFNKQGLVASFCKKGYYKKHQDIYESVNNTINSVYSNDPNSIYCVNNNLIYKE